jgi:mono/diheme cytochrome c family protein
MRHLLANILTYTIALLLFVGAVLFARMRSSQYTLTYQSTVLAGYEPAEGEQFRWREIGAQTYRRNCQSCHGRDGSGWDQYPGVRNASTMAQNPAGRAQLIDIHLHGLARQGSPTPMPGMGHLHDVEVAAVLNHIVEVFGSDTTAHPFTPSEIRQRRSRSDGM